VFDAGGGDEAQQEQEAMQQGLQVLALDAAQLAQLQQALRHFPMP
jgi:hypothetical protein